MTRIIYGADYNPEQWSEDIWQEDMRLMREAKVTMVNLNIFGWALIEQSEANYNFDQLDQLMDLLYKTGIEVDLATATAAQPAWLSKKYKDILPEDASMNKIWYGSRQTYCPNSPNYIRRMKALVRAISKRYKDHPALKMWHINNEYSDHTSICYCDRCATAFREWLRSKYHLSELNERWGTDFWSQKYYEFEEIIPPRQTSADHNPGLLLDYKRFMSDSFLNLYNDEYKILKKQTPKIPITTNFMGNNTKPLDYFKWAKSIDVISWDSYPDIAIREAYISNAFTHDLMRSLRKQPHIMMEQAPNQVNWRDTNPNKRPGQMMAYSLQCIARGGKGVMFFQWRQSLKGAEKFHSGMIPHAGEKSRVFKEIVALGKRLNALKLNESCEKNQAAILMDYDNWWALEYEPGPSKKMKYMAQIMEYYTYFYNENIPVDICSYDEDLSDYAYVITPNLYMVKAGLTSKLEAYVSCGGQLICGPFSGIVDESDTVFENGYPGPLSELFGIKIEEYDALIEEKTFEWFGQDYNCHSWCDVISLNGGRALGVYNEDYYKHKPTITENSYGLGKAYYIGTRLGEYATKNVLNRLCKLPGIRTPKGVEVTNRNELTFVINHTSSTHHIEMTLINEENESQNEIILKPFEVFIGRRTQNET